MKNCICGHAYIKHIAARESDPDQRRGICLVDGCDCIAYRSSADDPGRWEAPLIGPPTRLLIAAERQAAALERIASALEEIATRTVFEAVEIGGNYTTPIIKVEP